MIGFDPCDCFVDCIGSTTSAVVVAPRDSPGDEPRAPLLPEPARDAAPLASPRHGVLHAQRGRQAADRQTEQRGAPEVLRRRRDGKGRRVAAPKTARRVGERELGRGPGGGAAGPVLRSFGAIDAAGMRELSPPCRITSITTTPLDASC